MFKLKRIFVISMIFILILGNLYLSSYAASIEITKDGLKNSLNNYADSDVNVNGYKFIIDDSIITITENLNEYKLKYDLTNKPTFSYEVEVKQGMSYDEFENKSNELTLPFICYSAIANINGIDFKDSELYYALNLLSVGLSELSNNNSNYIIVKDNKNNSDNINVEITSNSSKTIHESEFGDHVMEYVNSLYNEKTSYKDSEGINSYEWILEKKNITDTSCTLSSTISINTDADFSKIKSYMDSFSDSFMNKEITEQNTDLLIKLKVGQKCELKSSTKITGYSKTGSDCISFNDEKNLITATTIGKANGYIYFDDNTKKSFYVIVEDNSNNDNFENIEIKLDINTNNTKNEQEAININESTETANKETTNNASDIIEDKNLHTNTEQNNNDTEIDSTVINSIIPQTGTKEILLKLILPLILILLFCGIKNKKYKDL